ncbi:pre-mRNA splicing factor [Coprinopsis cinerea okayama7|uniref:Pre-mRNA-splicing factor 18 n=1 Tax=Coprinopsis cinerea (strain Okayama-7 / 130 / ATCC MYA-4618 / FGSC 9003) TaxID=240176 RepID=A8P4J3_COPC7|nr:pre-mRNA splicing factor [Coprinopsis cinerea okayama7\|eukprot:XP_001838760.1 pre-mRNA splicing factor [Coprinopsis cinerea okayama7\
MDALKAEIAAKRKVLEEDPILAQRPTKYMRRGDIERIKEEQERKAEEEKRRKQEEERREAEARASAKRAASKSKSPSKSPGLLSSEREGSEQPKESTFNTISNEETIRRLRAKGQPIRLFGESDKDRRLRLRALELIEEKDHARHGGQNDFKKALEDVEKTEQEMKAKAEAQAEKGKKKDTTGERDGSGNTILDLDLIKTDPDRLYPIIYYALKRILKEWEESMDERPEEVKRTRQGKLAAATQVQSAEYLKPLFKQLRSRSLPSDMLARIAEIVHFTQKRQYQRANDAYLRLSIGNAPWPIGVTMVGIHERSAREKISADQVAHVLNDEVSRKYIQSLKRLITFSQTRYPPDDISQLMG